MNFLQINAIIEGAELQLDICDPMFLERAINNGVDLVNLVISLPISPEHKAEILFDKSGNNLPRLYDRAIRIAREDLADMALAAMSKMDTI